MIEKPKNGGIARKPQRTGAIILITIGVILLLMNTGFFSFGDIGEFFGGLGAAMGTFFGGLGSVIANLWPFALIIIGVALLVWRKPNRQAE